MKELSLLEGNVPAGFRSDFESFLFNEERHRLLQSPSGWHSYYLIRKSAKKILASLHFHDRNGSAVSPARAPFGSVEFSEKLNPLDLYEFLKDVEAALRRKGVTTIWIKNSPEVYRPAQAAVLHVLLLNLGYNVAQAEISTVIAVDDIPYDQKIEAWEVRKLKQSKKAGLRVQELNIRSFSGVYEFIKDCRLERQQSLSMNKDELNTVAEAFPKRIILFGVYEGDQLAAASISILVNQSILYNFYSAHARKFDSLSPVVTLMSGMYEWSKASGVELIDLGTSAVEGQPNFPLLDFKMRLSGSPSSKLTFEKSLG